MYNGYYYGFDTTYLLLVVPALLIALIASLCSYGIDSLEKKICPWRREIM